MYIIGVYMEEFSKHTDEELWHLASSGVDDAETVLVERYVRLVRICARPLFLAGGAAEDLIQEGMFGLLAAVRRFSPERDASFRTFAEHCIRNRLYTAIKSAAGPKHLPLNEYISLESSHFDESQSESSLYLRNPEDLVISRERVEEIKKILDDSLSDFESRVLESYLNGYSYSEISELVCKPPKSVDNAVQRIRKKLTQRL